MVGGAPQRPAIGRVYVSTPPGPLGLDTHGETDLESACRDVVADRDQCGGQPRGDCMQPSGEACVDHGKGQGVLYKRSEHV